MRPDSICATHTPFGPIERHAPPSGAVAVTVANLSPVSEPETVAPDAPAVAPDAGRNVARNLSEIYVQLATPKKEDEHKTSKAARSADCHVAQRRHFAAEVEVPSKESRDESNECSNEKFHHLLLRRA